jgi:hypothetical protein
VRQELCFFSARRVSEFRSLLMNEALHEKGAVKNKGLFHDQKSNIPKVMFSRLRYRP